MKYRSLWSVSTWNRGSQYRTDRCRSRGQVPDLVLARVELGHAPEHRPIALHVLEGEVFADAVAVCLGPDVGGDEESLDLGGEQDPVGRRVQVEGLHSEVIAGQQHLLGLPIVEGEGEHAVQPLDALRPPLLVGLQDDLRVGGRAEQAAAGLQLLPQLHVVVDLAVEDDHRSLGGHGLLPAGQVDDREALVGEGHRPLREPTGRIRSAVTDGGGHADREVLAGGLTVESEDARDSAHGLGSHRREHARRHSPVPLPATVDHLYPPIGAQSRTPTPTRESPNRRMNEGPGRSESVP